MEFNLNAANKSFVAQSYIRSSPTHSFNFIASPPNTTSSSVNHIAAHQQHYSSFQNFMFMAPANELCRLPPTNFPKLQYYYIHSPYQPSSTAKLSTNALQITKKDLSSEPSPISISSPITATQQSTSKSSNFTIDALLNHDTEATPDTTTVIKTDETKATVYNWLYSSRYKPPKFNSKFIDIVYK